METDYKGAAVIESFTPVAKKIAKAALYMETPG